MNISPAGISFIQDREGFRPRAYKPVANERGYTVGFGHKGPDVYQGMHVTPAEAMKLLRDDLAIVTSCINKSVIIGLQQCEFDALCSLAYNVGTGSWLQSHARALLNDRDFDSFDMQAFGIYGWIHDASGALNPGLVKRRQLEHALFFRCDYDDAINDSSPAKPVV